MSNAVTRSDIMVADERYLTEALRLAARIPQRPWPNPPVGAVIVKDGAVVGRGAHQGAGSTHAEARALSEAGGRADGATLYCTLEPCNHTGRTPPCAPAVLAAGIKRVVVGVRDPNPEVTGGGLQWLVARGVEVQVGVLAAEALELIWPFVVTDAFNRPFVLLKTATSLDCRFSTDAARLDQQDGGPVYLTAEPALRDGHILRRWVDLVLVGEQTVSIDKPRLDGRLVGKDGDCPRADPAVGYVDSDLSYAEGWDQERYFVFCSEDSADADATESVRKELAAAGGIIVPCSARDGHVDPTALLDTARQLELHCLMVEGGPRLAAAFLASGLVDRWVQYHAPLVVGSGVQWPDRSGDAVSTFSLTRAGAVGRDLRLVYDRRSFTATLSHLTRQDELNPMGAQGE